MIPSGLEPRPDLELSHAMRAFGFTADTTNGARERTDLPEELLGHLAELAPFEFLVLDLRGPEPPRPVAFQVLGDLAARLAESGRQLVCLADEPPSGEEPSFAVVADTDELYAWLVRRGVRKRPTSPVPLFSITAEDVAEMRAKGVPLGDLIRDLEAMQDSA